MTKTIRISNLHATKEHAVMRLAPDIEKPSQTYPRAFELAAQRIRAAKDQMPPPIIDWPALIQRSRQSQEDIPIPGFPEGRTITIREDEFNTVCRDYLEVPGVQRVSLKYLCLLVLTYAEMELEHPGSKPQTVSVQQIGALDDLEKYLILLKTASTSPAAQEKVLKIHNIILEGE